MHQNLLYELHFLQFSLLKKNSKTAIPITIKSSPKICLKGLEVIPKSAKEKIPVAILFHGYTANYRRIAYIARLFISNGIAVVLINLRGHGGSSGKQRDVKGMQKDLDNIIDFVKSRDKFDLNRILLLGMSLGALISLTSGYNHPAVTYIIALAGLSSPTDLLEGMTHFRRWRWKQIPKLGGLDVQGMIGENQFIPSMQPKLKESSKKILLLHCKNDTLVNATNFWTNVTAFNLGKQNYYLFPRGAHSFFLIKNRVIEEIQKWLWSNDFYKAE